MQANRGGRPAHCAERDANGVITKARCGLPACNYCKRRRQRIAREARKAISARIVGQPAAEPARDDRQHRVAASAQEYFTSELAHSTKASVTVPPALQTAAPVLDWSSFGPAAPDPEKTDDEVESDNQAEQLAEQLANPDPGHVMFAGVLMSAITWSETQMHEAGGTFWLDNVPEAYRPVVMSTLEGFALQFAVRWVPSGMEPPPIVGDCVILGAVLGSVVPVLAMKRKEASEAPEPEQYQDDEGDVIDIPQETTATATKARSVTEIF